MRLPSLTDQERIALDESLAAVSGDLGKCESFLRTPIPLGYTRYSVRFLWVWLTMLPFALTRAFCGFQAGTWWEGKLDEPWPLVVASVGFVAAIFLSIEDIAVQIEEPFAVLPLEFQHEWLKRDVQKSRRLLRWSSERLRAMAPCSTAPSPPSRLLKQRARVVGAPSPPATLPEFETTVERTPQDLPDSPLELEAAQGQTPQEQLSGLLRLKIAGVLTEAEYIERREAVMSEL